MTVTEYLVKPYFRLLPYDLASVLAAAVWGQKQYLTPLQYEIFQKTGLLHLLVLSGQNITLFLGFFAGLERFFGYKFKLYLTVFIAMAYIFIFSGKPPIVRASIMATLAALTVFLDKQTQALYLTFLAAVIMLALRPNWIGNISFWLSFSATAGIVVFYPYFKQKFRQPLLDPFFVSLSAQILTTPILLFAFREVSLLALPMNVLVAWLVEPIMFLGVLLSAVGLVSVSVARFLAISVFGIVKIFIGLVEFGYQIGGFLTIRI